MREPIACIHCGNTDQSKDVCHDYCQFPDDKTERIISVLVFIFAVTIMAIFISIGIVIGKVL